MTTWKKALSEGQLQQAITLLIEEIKSAPKDASLRSSFIELLCINGDLERADDQLIQSIKLFPEYLAGASQLRHLVKAAQARKDFSEGAATAQFVEGDSKVNELIIELNLAIKNKDYESGYELAQQLEKGRTTKRFSQNGSMTDEVRDIDDRLSGYVELFSTAGNYFLVPIKNIKYLEVKDPSSLLENVWRPVEFDIEGLGEGEGHMPLTYIDSSTDAQKLAKETDWIQLGASELFVGSGQKCWLVGDKAVPIFELNQLSETTELA
ncbi:protein of avirulence locus [Vibrio harveyi]|uniref:type VI secretion system accessory protein TagJ n=1 Tax=Vibrio harveyi TaxID=669 RepID=UPI000C7BC89A|nr:type VI secretion system accessory protein TagJ [Vibrio harveyi]AWB01638.1 protein of avirulence locus [Vibrio harveyi]